MVGERLSNCMYGFHAILPRFFSGAVFHASRLVCTLKKYITQIAGVRFVAIVAVLLNFIGYIVSCAAQNSSAFIAGRSAF